MDVNEELNRDGGAQRLKEISEKLVRHREEFKPDLFNPDQDAQAAELLIRCQVLDEQLQRNEYYKAQVEPSRKTYLTKVTEKCLYTPATAPLVTNTPPANEAVSATPAMDLLNVLQKPRSRTQSKDESKDDSSDAVVNEESVKGCSKGSVSKCTSRSSSSDESSASKVHGFGKASTFKVGQADPLESISMQAMMLAQKQGEIIASEPPPLPPQKPLPQEAASSSRPFSGVTGFKSEAEILAG